MRFYTKRRSNSCTSVDTVFVDYFGNSASFKDASLFVSIVNQLFLKNDMTNNLKLRLK